LSINRFRRYTGRPRTAAGRNHRSVPINATTMKRGDAVFNRDGLFGRKGDTPRLDTRASVNVTPGLNNTAAPAPRPQSPPAEVLKPDLRFTESAITAARVEETAGGRLVVGRGIKVNGAEITDCDTLIVEGRVEASIVSRTLHIGETGIFSGTASVDTAEIRGRYEGDLTARKHVVIHAGGRVTGRVRYVKIKIEEGGEVSGEVTTLQAIETPALMVLTPEERDESQLHSPVTAPVSAEPAQPASAPSTSRPILGSRQRNQTGRGAGI
jgi:cytoskeletal protein CcmA (bactofilin family)